MKDNSESCSQWDLTDSSIVDLSIITIYSVDLAIAANMHRATSPCVGNM